MLRCYTVVIAYLIQRKQATSTKLFKTCRLYSYYTNTGTNLHNKLYLPQCELTTFALKDSYAYSVIGLLLNFSSNITDLHGLEILSHHYC